MSEDTMITRTDPKQQKQTNDTKRKGFYTVIALVLIVLGCCAGSASAQQAACIVRCETIRKACDEPCRQEALAALQRCEDAGGSTAACQASYENTRQNCLSRTAETRNTCMRSQGCEMCFGRFGVFYCQCGDPWGGLFCEVLNYDFDLDFFNPQNQCDCIPGDPGCLLHDPDSPIIYDVNNDGLRLTSAATGVRFDIRASGSLKQIAWTEQDSDDAWLVLDRNGNGTIDTGAELFGNYTPQSTTTNKNGFAALKDYDLNLDGVITSADVAYQDLRFWQDGNHNGQSEPEELRTLSGLGVYSIGVEPHESMRKDKYGNVFRYRAKVNGSRYAWDVFLTTVQQ